ncbi:hypothetical protein [Chitinophaga sancti]|uniref:Lipoprotein n=1 Tax=Chitinophaga sancti TaxID=1004 RepID=A0A1K1R5G8_9BACT|nr:hypothetical protein [Chitinophaga sancti]WQD64276.1 hypothetical protein U0033_07705 [Chitinophaga sancti]WQG90100.1 hypothetical protein SR876_01215 [Chitinophaga sancti]SFW66854.1 hypothetical protein SAMN05661012_03367 [Chitinophaga sancti]
MKYGIILCCLVLVFCACKHSKKEVMQAIAETGMLQDKEENGFHYRLQYMPATKNDDLLRFRLKISNSNGTALKEIDGQAYTYGLDSMFAFVNVADTSAPVDVVRIANGNIGGLEYMLVFERPLAYSQANCRLLFRDYLFNHKFLTFPIQGDAIKHIDSLSLNI